MEYDIHSCERLPSNRTRCFGGSIWDLGHQDFTLNPRPQGFVDLRRLDDWGLVKGLWFSEIVLSSLYSIPLCATALKP